MKSLKVKKVCTSSHVIESVSYVSVGGFAGS